MIKCPVLQLVKTVIVSFSTKLLSLFFITDQYCFAANASRWIRSNEHVGKHDIDLGLDPIGHYLGLFVFLIGCMTLSGKDSPCPCYYLI